MKSLYLVYSIISIKSFHFKIFEKRFIYSSGFHLYLCTIGLLFNRVPHGLHNQAKQSLLAGERHQTQCKTVFSIVFNLQILQTQNTNLSCILKQIYFFSIKCGNFLRIYTYEVGTCPLLIFLKSPKLSVLNLRQSPSRDNVFYQSMLNLFISDYITHLMKIQNNCKPT